MEWSDEAVVLATRRHGETGVILEALTRAHGRHLGLVHGGRSRRMRPCLQPGNGVAVTWQSRIEEQLGTFAVEPREMRAARVIGSAPALHAVNYLCVLMHLLPEREPHPDLYARTAAILDAIDDPAAIPAQMVRLELATLGHLGFGLDLARCAATGTTEDLAYVSPKSGRAVCREAGEPYRDRMLPFPAFLRSEGGEANLADLAAGFRLLDFFLRRDVFAPRGIGGGEARSAYLRACGLTDPQSSVEQTPGPRTP